MATFSSPESFKEHKQYVVLLKKALLQVKGEAKKKFLYFKQYPFGPKKLQLVLVDFDVGLPAVLAKAGFKPVDEGIVSLTPQDELNFEPKKGSLKRVRLKKYFATMGSGIKEVYVPPGEVDDEEEGEEKEVTEGQLPPPPTEQPPPPPQPLPGEGMKKKLEFEQKQFELRQRIEELRKQPVAAPLEQLKAQALKKAAELVAGGKFAEATQLLDQFAKKASEPVAPTPTGQKPPVPPPEKPEAPPPSPRLSTYMNAARDWKEAKKVAGNGILALKNAIMKECDKEVVDLVKPKLDQLNGIFSLLDDAIIGKIEDAGRESDPERQVELNRAVARFASQLITTIRNHPHANVVDSNPFGNFTIRAPVEAVLTRYVTDFGG